MIGPDAGEILQSWLNAMPFDPTMLSEGAAVSVFRDWLDQMAKGAPQTAPTADVGPLEPVDRPGVDDELLAQAEAAASGGEPPGPQPADADMEADASPPPTVVQCPLCGGKGIVDIDLGGGTATCGMCQGAKVVRMATTP